MLRAMAKVLPTAARVTEQLLERFGADVIQQIQQLGEKTFHARTTDGRLLMVSVLEDGELAVKEAEAVG